MHLPVLTGHAVHPHPFAAGVERNAKIGLDEEARKKDIPIVQVKPTCSPVPVACLCQVLLHPSTLGSA